MDLLLWARVHKKALKVITALFASVLLVISWSYKMAHHGQFVSTDAQQLFKEWKRQDNSEEGAIALKKLAGFLNENTFLQKSYDENIAQILIARGQLDEAKPFVKRVLKQIKDPFCKRFSLATMEISSGSMDRALKLSVALKEDLENQLNSFLGAEKALYYHLYHFSLYRISFLLEKLDRKEEAELVLEELKEKLFDEEGVPTHEGQSFLEVFSRRGFSFQEYLSKKKPK